MGRIRTIKPSFFSDEELADLPALDRLLFIGLWTEADSEGRLEDRPRRLKAILLPYDDHNVDEALTRLHESGFIVRYVVDDGVKEERFIQVRTFDKHQRLSGSEANAHSELPSLEAARKHSGKTEEAHSKRFGTLEGKGKEGKGKEGEGATSSSLPLPSSASPQKQTKPKTEPIDIPSELRESKPFCAAWAEWLTHRKEKRSPLTPTTAKNQLKKFVEWGPERSVAAIEQSIANGWTGVFEPKQGDLFGGNARASPSQTDDEYADHLRRKTEETMALVGGEHEGR